MAEVRRRKPEHESSGNEGGEEVSGDDLKRNSTADSASDHVRIIQLNFIN
mgnify:CR=1 FL=1